MKKKQWTPSDSILTVGGTARQGNVTSNLSEFHGNLNPNVFTAPNECPTETAFSRNHTMTTNANDRGGGSIFHLQDGSTLNQTLFEQPTQAQEAMILMD